MPTRYVRSQILESKRYHSVGPIERLAFVELLLLADDFGVVPIHALFLSRRTTAFTGLSEEAMAAKIDGLEKADLIRTYVTSGAALAWLPRNGFLRRAKKSQHPLPDFEEPQNIGRFNELKNLTGNCKTHAVQAHSRRRVSASHPYPTPTPTTTTTPTANASNAEIEVWTFGVELLTRDGDKPLENGAARSFIGSLLKSWSPEAVLDACRAAVGTKVPTGYLQAVLKKKPKIGETSERYD